MSEEMRAFNNLRWYRATQDAPYSLIGLNGYGPNLNIARDPRYGRISEVPGEDPFLTGTYAVEMVRAGQGMDAFESGSSKFLKMTLGLKHYALYVATPPCVHIHYTFSRPHVLNRPI
jgi:beta-glucosidase-like glycosyl hydrolase